MEAENYTKFTKGDQVKYLTRKDGSTSASTQETSPWADAEVVDVHFDDPPDPYYTIRLESPRVAGNAGGMDTAVDGNKKRAFFDTDRNPLLAKAEEKLRRAQTAIETRVRKQETGKDRGFTSSTANETIFIEKQTTENRLRRR